MEWYYTNAKKQNGPISLQDLLYKISVGELNGNDYAWREGFEEWQPISNIPELQITSKSAGAGPPPVPYHSINPPQGMSAKSHTSGLAIASLCLGIGSIILCGIILGIPAVICGHLALGEIKRSQPKLEGKTMAVIGLITGYLSILSSVGMIFFFLLLGNAAILGFDQREDVGPEMMHEQLQVGCFYQQTLSGDRIAMHGDRVMHDVLHNEC